MTRRLPLLPLAAVALLLPLSACSAGDGGVEGVRSDPTPSQSVARIPVLPSPVGSGVDNSVVGAEPKGTVGPEGESGASPSPGDSLPPNSTTEQQGNGQSDGSGG